MSFWRRPFSGRDGGDAVETEGASPQNSAARSDELSDGSLVFVAEKAGNDSPPSYQEATGAPVEVDSPLGYTVGPVTIIFLNISMMIGTGVYSTPATILKGVGSIGLALIYWALGFVISLSSLAVYLEYASYFPNRSGSEVVYLEQAYPRPRWLFPTTFAFQSVTLSFSSGNAIVLANYLFKTNGHTPTNWQLKGVAVVGYTVAYLFVSFHTRFSYWVSNTIGIVKVITLVFIALTGLVILGGHTRVKDSHAHFANSFEGTSDATAYGLTNALYKIIFSYAGYTNAFNVVNEVKSPVKTLRRNAFIALFAVAVLYILANIAYFAAVPADEFRTSSLVAASLFFTAVFGDSAKVRGLNFLIALSAFGNLIAVLLGTSRMLRECGRQGVLPWPRFWASTKPFGTPFGPYTVKWFLTIVMILAPPAGDAFNFITDLKVYPSAVFDLLMAIGIFVVRWRRKRLNLPRPEFRAWDVALVFSIVVQVFLLVMPWYPPPAGGADVSFWYGTYIVTGIAILIGCGIYYWLWIYGIPKVRGYRVRQEVVFLEDGARSHTIRKVPVAQLAEWDATHDSVGAPIDPSTGKAVTGSNASDKDSSKDGVNDKESGNVTVTAEDIEKAPGAQDGRVGDLARNA